MGFTGAVDPLADEEVPPFVRNAINAMYPSYIDEIEMRAIGVPEIDLLFSCGIEPISMVSNATADIYMARNDALRKCGMLKESDQSPCNDVQEAMRELKAGLRRANREHIAAGRSAVAPTWAPPKLRSASAPPIDSYVAMKFVRFNLDKEDEETGEKPNQKLLDAVKAMELFWDLNMRMYKAMSQQRKAVYFLSACAKTDSKRYQRMIFALLGLDPTDKASVAKNTGKAAVSVPDPNDSTKVVAIAKGENMNPRLQVLRISHQWPLTETANAHSHLDAAGLHGCARA